MLVGKGGGGGVSLTGGVGRQRGRGEAVGVARLLLPERMCASLWSACVKEAVMWVCCC